MSLVRSGYRKTVAAVLDVHFPSFTHSPWGIRHVLSCPMKSTISVLYRAHLCMKCSFGISDFLDEISSLSHSVVFLYFFALIIVECSMWSTGEGNDKPLQYSCLENPMNSMKRQNYRILKEELPRLVSAQYATGEQWRNNSRKNEGMEPKQNNTQLWMGLMMEARSDAVKSNIA